MPLDKTARAMLTGSTPFFACTDDPRFSFCLYVPKCHSFDGPRLPLLVAVHGTRRQTAGYITHLQTFSEEHRVVILCPLFPAGIIDPYDVHNYKKILYHDIRFDLVLLSMLTQAAGVWRIDADRFFLHGFSGGGQFAHRFLYLHPTRLRGVSIGSPGSVTHPTTAQPWPIGLADVKTIFGAAPDFTQIARVPVQVIVGEKDTDTSGIGRDEVAGRTRLDRARYLNAALFDRGVSSELSIVPGAAHEERKIIPAMEAWLAPLLAISG